MLKDGLVKPTVYNGKYLGLENVVTAMKDLGERKVWGKAVVSLDDAEHKPRL